MDRPVCFCLCSVSLTFFIFITQNQQKALIFPDTCCLWYSFLFFFVLGFLINCKNLMLCLWFLVMIQLIYAISYIPDHWVLIFKWVLFLLFRSGFVESAITQCLCFFYLLLIIIIVTYLLILQLHESAIFYQKCFSHPLLSIYTPFLPLSSWNYKTIPEWCKMAYCPLSDVKWLYHALRDTSSSHNISTQKVNLGQFLTQLKPIPDLSQFLEQGLFIYETHLIISC